MVTCRGCGSESVTKVVDLGPQPAADYFPPAESADADPRWPLELWLCAACTLVQLGPIQPLLPEEPLAVESATSLAHAESSVKEILTEHPELAGGVVHEFASHHGGSWLSHLRAACCRIAREGEPADLVIDVHGLVHEPATGDMLKLRADRLAPEGLLILEFHHLLPLVEGNQFDTVRHGHWSYFSLGAIAKLAVRHGLGVESVRKVDQFGGSLQVLLRHGSPTPDASVQEILDAETAAGLADPARLAELHQAALRTASALHRLLAGYQAEGRTVLGYGAPSKAPLLLGVSEIGPELLPFTVDKSPAKHGRRIPGSAIPIRSVDDLRAAEPDAVLVFTWDIADEIVSQLEADGAGWGATYLVPFPEPHALEHGGQAIAGREAAERGHHG